MKYNAHRINPKEAFEDREKLRTLLPCASWLYTIYCGKALSQLFHDCSCSAPTITMLLY